MVKLCRMCGYDIDRTSTKDCAPEHQSRAMAAKMIEVLNMVCLPCVEESGISKATRPEEVDTALSQTMVRMIEQKRHSKRWRKRYDWYLAEMGCCLARLALLDFYIVRLCSFSQAQLDLEKSNHRMFVHIKKQGFNLFHTQAAVMRKMRSTYGIKGRVCFWHVWNSFVDEDRFGVFVFGEAKKCTSTAWICRDSMTAYYTLKGHLNDHHENLNEYGRNEELIFSEAQKFARWEKDLMHLDAFNAPLVERFKMYKRAKKQGFVSSKKAHAEHCRDLQKQAIEKGF